MAGTVEITTRDARRATKIDGLESVTPEELGRQGLNVTRVATAENPGQVLTTGRLLIKAGGTLYFSRPGAELFEKGSDVYVMAPGPDQRPSFRMRFDKDQLRSSGS